VERDGEGEVQAVDQLSGHRKSPVSGRAREKDETSRSENMNWGKNHLRSKETAGPPAWRIKVTGDISHAQPVPATIILTLRED
jgi:hypothetical protein